MSSWRTIVVEDDAAVQALIRDMLKLRLHVSIMWHPADVPSPTREHTCRCRSDFTRCADFLILKRYTRSGDALNWVENQRARGCRIPKVAVTAEKWLGEDKQKAVDLGCAVFDRPVDVLAIDKWLEDGEKELAAADNYAELSPDVPEYVNRLFNWTQRLRAVIALRSSAVPRVGK